MSGADANAGSTAYFLKSELTGVTKPMKTWEKWYWGVFVVALTVLGLGYWNRRMTKEDIEVRCRRPIVGTWRFLVLLRLQRCIRGQKLHRYAIQSIVDLHTCSSHFCCFGRALARGRAGG